MGMQELIKPTRIWIDNFYEDLVLEFSDNNLIVRLPLAFDNRIKLLKVLK